MMMEGPLSCIFPSLYRVVRGPYKKKRKSYLYKLTFIAVLGSMCIMKQRGGKSSCWRTFFSFCLYFIQVLNLLDCDAYIQCGSSASVCWPVCKLYLEIPSKIHLKVCFINFLVVLQPSQVENKSYSKPPQNEKKQVTEAADCTGLNLEQK